MATLKLNASIEQPAGFLAGCLTLIRCSAALAGSTLASNISWLLRHYRSGQVPANPTDAEHLARSRTGHTGWY